MARILGLFPAALTAARGGMSANAFYRELQDLGLGGRRSEVLSLFKIAKSITVRSADEPFRGIESVPRGNELAPWPVKNPNGVMQNVSIAYRDKATGELKQTFYRVVTPNGITREEAMARAISAYSDAADRYGQELIGAVHTSSYIQTPLDLSE